MTIQNKRIFASILFVLISFVCASQELPPPGPPTPPPGFVPIDGGVLIGACFALFYGVRKIFQKTDS
ncbi:PID-CTERM protein-sorting domain-containing protein [Thalassobellus sediminis]|uniref:PID-CTERM protein-sorting domain-containing protein n=1 Tax=Thalassobellus sediminis TaxID=3367753 RepID=UPI0037903380